MLTPETPQAAAGAPAEVAEGVTGERPATADASWDSNRATDLDPSRVDWDDRQSPAERSEGEPDE